MTFDDLQYEVGEWHRRMFSDATPSEIVLKTCSEVGELADCQQHLNLHGAPGAKAASEWRSWEAKRNDAIGDIIICLAALCERVGISLESVVERTWAEVETRSIKRVRDGKQLVLPQEGQT